MGHKGEISVDQAHRGYNVATDASGYGSVNPLFWKPTRDAATGEFSGQRCYGYISFEAMVTAAIACNGGDRTPADFDNTMPTLATTAGATAILEVRAPVVPCQPVLCHLVQRLWRVHDEPSLRRPSFLRSECLLRVSVQLMHHVGRARAHRPASARNRNVTVT